MITTILAVIGGIAVVLAAAARLPTAAAEVLRSCITLVNSFHALRRAWQGSEVKAVPRGQPRPR